MSIKYVFEGKLYLLPDDFFAGVPEHMREDYMFNREDKDEYEVGSMEQRLPSDDNQLEDRCVIDAKIERIDNGFIINDFGGREYFPTIKEWLDESLGVWAYDLDNEYKRDENSVGDVMYLKVMSKRRV